MKMKWTIIAIALISIFTTACAALQPKPISGEDAGIQNYLGLFTIMPPQGENWYEIQRKEGLLAYGKKLEASTHTFIASVQVTRTDKNFASEIDFLSFVKNARATDTNPERFNMLLHDEKVDNSRSAFCTKFHQKAEDKVASKSSGNLSILEIKGFTCLHPKQPLIVTIEYSERSSTPFNNDALLKEGEGFINSLQLK